MISYLKTIYKSITSNIISIIILLVIALFFYGISKYANENLYIPWIITNIIWAIIILIFIDSFVQKRDKKRELQNKIKKTRYFNKLLISKIHEYKENLKDLIDIDYSWWKLKIDFDFKLLRWIYFPWKGFSKPTYKYCIESQKEILEYLKIIIEYLDEEKHERISKLILDYIGKVESSNQYDSIMDLDNEYWFTNKIKELDHLEENDISKMIIDYNWEIKINDFNRWNRISYFILLYKMINYELMFFDNYINLSKDNKLIEIEINVMEKK